jgi:DNA recombination protein Rad52
MSFSDQQIKRLRGKLEGNRVKTREHQGRSLSYVEGWYVMAEANRIFGFDGWDRLSQSHQLVHHKQEADLHHVAYVVRARVIVKSGTRDVVREGTGFGAASDRDPGEAHELAIKAAETDATKRALATFGNRFGLALYDKALVGVKKATVTARGPSDAGSPQRFPVSRDAALAVEPAPDPDDAALGMQSALVFLKALRERLRRVVSKDELEDILKRTEGECVRLREVHPDLRDRHGKHLVDVAMSIAALRRHDLERGISRASQGARAPSLHPPIDKSVLAHPTTKRYRNKDHLKRLSGLPCLACGRKPSHAHHLRFAQGRGLGLKVSDEFTVPLCAIDHDALHRSGDERKWWEARGIDPLPVAEALWTASRTAPVDRTEANGTGSGTTALDAPLHQGDGAATGAGSHAGPDAVRNTPQDALQQSGQPSPHSTQQNFQPGPGPGGPSAGRI